MKEVSLKWLHAIWLQLSNNLEKAKWWEVPVVARSLGRGKDEAVEHKRFLGQWKYSVHCYNKGYMSLCVCVCVCVSVCVCVCVCLYLSIYLYRYRYINWAVATGLEKVHFIPIPKKDNAKEGSNYHTLAFISHTSKVMLKIIQARLQQCEPWTSRCSSWI